MRKNKKANMTDEDNKVIKIFKKIFIALLVITISTILGIVLRNYANFSRAIPIGNVLIYISFSAIPIFVLYCAIKNKDMEYRILNIIFMVLLLVLLLIGSTGSIIDCINGEQVIYLTQGEIVSKQGGFRKSYRYYLEGFDKESNKHRIQLRGKYINISEDLILKVTYYENINMAQNIEIVNNIE